MTRRKTDRRRFLAAGLLLVLLPAAFVGPSAHADESPSGEYAVKMALIYNFARFTIWPDSAFDAPDDPLRLVVFGDPELLQEFTALDQKDAAGRPIEVHITTRPEDAAACHLLFLSHDQRDAWPQVSAAITGSSTLTIGEMNGFLESGGTMNLVLQGKRVKFQINVDNMRARSLQISSRILKLAAKVIDSGRPNS